MTLGMVATILAVVLIVSWVAWRVAKGMDADRISELEAEKNRIKSNVSESEERFQEVLRRELANIIQDISLEDFEQAFEKMCDYEFEIERAKEERRQAELNLLIQKYEFFKDFDIIGTRHFVRYDRDQGTSEYIERYCDISKFLILNKEKSRGRLYDDREIEVFRRNMKEQKNKRLRGRIIEAMDRYFRFRNSSGNSQSGSYEDADYIVDHLGRGYTPANEYKVICKKSGEYGIYSSYYDDERDKSSHMYYRTNSSFSESADEWI